MQVGKIIKEYVARSEATIVQPSHNMLEFRYLSDRIVLIHSGRVVYRGTISEAIESASSENLEEAYLEIVK